MKDVYIRRDQLEEFRQQLIWSLAEQRADRDPETVWRIRFGDSSLTQPTILAEIYIPTGPDLCVSMDFDSDGVTGSQVLDVPAPLGVTPTKQPTATR